MSLRRKFLTLFSVFGVLPVVGLGVYGYLGSMESVRDLVQERTAAIADQLSGEIQSRYALLKSDLILLGENAETLSLLQASAIGDSAELAAARASADTYLHQVWGVVGSSFRSVTLRNSNGVRVFGIGDGPLGGEPSDPSSTTEFGRFYTVREPVDDPITSERYGTLEAVLRLQALLPEEAIAASFGARGYSAVLDRETRLVLHHPSRSFRGQPVTTLTGPDGWNLDQAFLSTNRGSASFEEDGDRRIASFTNLADPAWTVLATGSVDEFSAPFARAQVLDLVLFLAVALSVWLGYLIMAGRLTRSLTALTDAADQVARGDLDPALPTPGTDEVGKLTGAFGLMLQRIREMLKRVRENRHMAAVGSFASQLSHEIRNPLTSVKLNLQSLQRGVEAGEVHESHSESVQICLKEVKRLEGVVKGVLSLARVTPPRPDPCSVHAALDSALRALTPQFEARGVHREVDLGADSDTVIGEAERLEGAFMNLLLNAIEALPDGGRLTVTTEVVGGPASESLVRVRIEDEGPGIPVEEREKIFEPFFSTKESGTGFGLALAQQTMEEHGGRLALEDSIDAGSGAVFLVDLPLASDAPEVDGRRQGSFSEPDYP
ncbi:MAG: sensor histidine kinase [Gemmatimonadetes bacterium]|nr:sensor histidine kinase [Gemmatimonadota bacterium]